MLISEWSSDVCSSDLTWLRATNDVIAYLKTVIEDRKQNPRDDIVTSGVQAKIEGGRALTDDELHGFCFNLFVGGLDTVSTNLTWQFLNLARNTAHQRELRSNPAMIPSATDEFMRAFESVLTVRVRVKET